MNTLVTSSDSSIISIMSFPSTVNIPANVSIIPDIPLTGESQGSANLTCRLNTPIGIINSGNDVTNTTVTVTAPKALQVTQQFTSDWQLTWDEPEYVYSYHLVLSSADEPVFSWELSFLLPDRAEVSQD